MSALRHRVRWSIPIVWAGGMLAARWVDPTIAIAAAATLLMLVVVATDRSFFDASFRPSVRLVRLGVAGAAVMTGTTYLLYPLLARWIPPLSWMTAAIYSRFLSARTIGTIGSLVVPLVIAEELLWRGAFQDEVRSRSAVATVLISASVYSLAHATSGSALLVVVAFVCGLFWAALRAASGSIIPSLIAHLIWDLALIIAPLVSHGMGYGLLDQGS